MGQRWILGVLATFGVTAAIAAPLLTDSGSAPPRATFGGGDASFYRVGSPAHQRFCERHKSFCLTARRQSGGVYLYSQVTARLVKVCYRSGCYTKAQALRLCKSSQGSKPLCAGWGIKQPAQH